MEKPYLIIVTGRPGSGKTTFAHAMSKKIYMPVISRDEIKEGYVHTFQKEHLELPEDTNLTVTNMFFEILSYFITHNISVIAEAAFQHRVWHKMLEPFMDKAKISIIICDIDGETALDRFIKRGLQDAKRQYFHGDKGVRMMKDGVKPVVGTYQTPKLDVLTISVDTLSDYIPSIEEISNLIFEKDEKIAR